MPQLKYLGINTNMPTPNWTTLRNGISGSVILPGESGYTTHRYGWNTRNGLTADPEAIAFPSNENDIRTIVKFAYDNGVTFTVRSGGHSYVAASNTNGLLLNLRGYTGITLYDGGKRVTVKSGTKMGDVYKFLYYDSGYTLTLPTADGGNEQVGIGLALGGGHSLRTGEYGLLCQRIRAARVVLYDGSVVECDNYKNSDLLWALKGGGGGAFGVVSELTFEPHEYKPIQTVYATFRTDGLTQAFSSWQNYLLVRGATVFTSASFFWPSSSRAKIYGEGGTGFDLRINIGFSGSTSEVKNYLETCGVLPAGVTYVYTTSTYSSVQTGPFSEITDSTFHFGLMAGQTFSQDAINTILSKTREFCLGICGGGTYSGLSGPYFQPPSIIMQSYRPTVNNDNTNSTSFPYKDALHAMQFRFSFTASTYGATPSRHPTIIQFLNDFFWEMASKTGYKAHSNYPFAGLTAYGATGYGKMYWGDNLVYLQQVKKTYDPNNFFNIPHSIPPLN